MLKAATARFGNTPMPRLPFEIPEVLSHHDMLIHGNTGVIQVDEKWKFLGELVQEWQMNYARMTEEQGLSMTEIGRMISSSIAAYAAWTTQLSEKPVEWQWHLDAMIVTGWRWMGLDFDLSHCIMQHAGSLYEFLLARNKREIEAVEEWMRIKGEAAATVDGVGATAEAEVGS